MHTIFLHAWVYNSAKSYQTEEIKLSMESQISGLVLSSEKGPGSQGRGKRPPKQHNTGARKRGLDAQSL